MANWIHERAHYRVAYPQAARPAFIPAGGDRAFPVVDCCETGIRFAPDHVDPEQASPGVGVSGCLRFRDGETLPVEGVVVRIQDGEVAVHLRDTRIPLKRIISEQVFLRSRYPLWPGEPEAYLVA